MPEFYPVNSIKAHCDAADLKHGQLIWAVMLDEKKGRPDIFPCRVLQRHDSRVRQGVWHIMYDLKFPVVKGLNVEWQTLWAETDCLFSTKEDALIAAEAWMREKLREDADFIEKISVDDTTWCCDPNTGACYGN